MMRKLTILTALAAFYMFTLGASPAAADAGVRDAWIAAYSDTTCEDLLIAVNECSFCHNSGITLNPYGDDLANNWADPTTIEDLDSDGDGRTNGEEILLDCSLPGDAVSPIEVETWSTIKTLFE